MKGLTVLGFTTCAGAALLASGALRGGATSAHSAGSGNGDDAGPHSAEAAAAQVAAEMRHAAAGATQTADAIDLAMGRQKFRETCATCHGPAGQGLPHQGADLRSSTFISGRSDDQLFEFLKVGRRPADPESRLGLVMPPRGGNVQLSDGQLRNIVAYLREVQRNATSDATSNATSDSPKDEQALPAADKR
jgi:mono/diheme cytochrome c family protein